MYKVSKYILDEKQSKIVTDTSKHLLVVAGAGSGKTLTILGKIDYLIKEKGLDPKEILCISFTREASNSLKQKLKKELNIDMDVSTFHKLGLEILKEYESFDIADSDTLENIIREFFREDCLYDRENLKIALKYFDISSKKEYKKFILNETSVLKETEKLFSTFLHLFKANDYKLEDFISFLHKAKSIFNIKNYFSEKLFLKLALNIYIKYQTYLKENGEIDFDDMLIRSKDYVLENGYKKIKYVIIDEFQDTSLVRFNLIKAILDKTDSSLMAVGDDFQSIYRFTGCDLDLFINFKRYFDDAKILKIQKTYRNSQELITVAGNFIMKNPTQIRKNLKSSKSIYKPIKIIYYTNTADILEKTIKYIVSKDDKRIMIIGRNNNDIYKYLNHNFKVEDKKITYKNFPDLDVTYLTAHKSKGLEEDNTIIVNMENGMTGFPNQIKDANIIRFVSNKKNHTLFDEERRLFYVALTRSKNCVYILVPRNNPSVFAQEIIRDYKPFIEYIKLFPGK